MADGCDELSQGFVGCQALGGGSFVLTKAACESMADGCDEQSQGFAGCQALGGGS